MTRTANGLKVTLLIPLKDNDDKPFDVSTWSRWNDRFTSLVAAFTDHGVATGQWRGHMDQNRVIVVIVRSLEEVNAIRELLVEACTWFRQHAMYLEYHEVYFEEVEPDGQTDRS